MRERLPSNRRGTVGQTATEYMMVISVVVIAVVAAAYQFVPSFQAGVTDLGTDVSKILGIGVGGLGSRGSAVTSVGSTPGGGPLPTIGTGGPSSQGATVYNGGPSFAVDPRSSSPAPTLGAPADPP